MTRKQAFLVLLIALLVLAGHQHIQWPSRFWESPSFQVLDWDDIAKGLSAEEPTPEASATEASTEKDPS